MTYTPPDTDSTYELTDIPDLGHIRVQRIVNEYGTEALNEISRIATHEPEKLTEIDRIGSQWATQLREEMIAADVYVPQPGDVFDSETTTKTISKVINTSLNALEETFPEWFITDVEGYLTEDFDPNNFANRHRVSITPDNATAIAIAAAIDTINNIDIQHGTEGHSEQLTPEEFKQLVHDTLIETWGDQLGEEILSHTHSINYVRTEGNHPLTTHGAKETIRSISKGYLYSFEHEMEEVKA